MGEAVQEVTLPLVAESAPCFQIPDKQLVTVEHPYIIQNLERGILSLGGMRRIRDLVQPEQRDKAEAALYQRPGNRWTNPIYSHNESTHNILLRVKVPKNQPFRERNSLEEAQFRTEQEDLQLEHEPAARLLQSIQASPRQCQVRVVGIIEQTHRFRTLTGFVKSSKDSPFMQKINETILPFDYQKMKNFTLDMTKGGEKNAEIIPPPTWSQLEVPFNYSYKQNPAVLTTMDHAGRPYTWNSQIRANNRSQVVAADSKTIPEGPASDLPAISTLDSTMQRLLALAYVVLNERPIVTRRSLPNFIPDDEWRKASTNHSKLLFRYLGYTFSSGPWKDALIKFGVDPRSDSKYRIYQTLTFMIDSPLGRRGSGLAHPQGAVEAARLLPVGGSHIFDGSRISPDGKTWQVCDITDPVLHNIFATEDLRQKCHLESDGWFHNGTWMKAKTVMKWKIAGILMGEDALTDTEYARVASILPEATAENDKLRSSDLSTLLTAKERELASTIRAQYRKVEGGDIAGQATREDALSRNEAGSPAISDAASDSPSDIVPDEAIDASD